MNWLLVLRKGYERLNSKPLFQTVDGLCSLSNALNPGLCPGPHACISCQEAEVTVLPSCPKEPSSEDPDMHVYRAGASLGRKGLTHS